MRAMTSEPVKRLFSTNLPKIIVSIAGMLFALYAGNRIAQPNFNYQDIIVWLVLVASVATFVLARISVQVGLLLWVGLFALGYRTVHITPDFGIHPLVLFILGLFMLTFAQSALIRQRTVPWPIPRLLLAFSIFWVWGWVVGLITGQHWDFMLAGSQSFFLIFPIFAVVGYALEKEGGWKALAAALLGVGTLIAALGLIEYTFPGSRALLPGLVSANAGDASLDQFGFTRALFAFWGAASATFIIALALPMAIPLWGWFHAPVQRFAIIAATIISSLGVFIGGYRSIWLTVAITVVLILYRRAGWKGGLLSALGFLIVYQWIPASGQSRFLSLISALQGNIQDSSSQDRWQRIVDAMTNAVNNPFGGGWGSSGWVHSDFVQVAADLGLLAGALFIVWYLFTLGSLWRLFRSAQAEPMVLGLLGSFAVAGAILLSEGGTVLPQTALPVWLVWAMAEVKLRQHKAHQVEVRGAREVGEAT